MKTLRFFKLFTCIGLLSINQNAYTANCYDFYDLSTEDYVIMGAHREPKGDERRVCDWAKYPEFTYLGVKMHKLVHAPRGKELPDGTTRLDEDSFFMKSNSFVVAALEKQGDMDVFAALKSYIIKKADKPGSDIIKPHGGARK